MWTVRKSFTLSPVEDRDIIEFLERESRQTGSVANTVRQALRTYLKLKERYGEFPYLPSENSSQHRQPEEDPEPSVAQVQKETVKADGLLLGGSDDAEVKNKLLKGFKGF